MTFEFSKKEIHMPTQEEQEDFFAKTTWEKEKETKKPPTTTTTTTASETTAAAATTDAIETAAPAASSAEVAKEATPAAEATIGERTDEHAPLIIQMHDDDEEANEWSNEVTYTRSRYKTSKTRRGDEAARLFMPKTTRGTGTYKHLHLRTSVDSRD